MAPDWLEDLKRLLEKLCEYMNGAPCSFTDSTPVSEQIATIYGLYQSNGCQGLSTEDAQKNLAVLKAHLALPANSLSTSDNDKLNTIITACWDG